MAQFMRAQLLRQNQEEAEEKEEEEKERLVVLRQMVSHALEQLHMVADVADLLSLAPLRIHALTIVEEVTALTGLHQEGGRQGRF